MRLDEIRVSARRRALGLERIDGTAPRASWPRSRTRAARPSRCRTTCPNPQRLFDEKKKAFGRLDVLVNNAGVCKFAALSPRTNSTDSLLAMWAALRQRHQYRLYATRTSLPATATYTATKGAVDSITGVLAK
jgi:NAD(P)-dependent dehydrogenase (short-subunit alcohol dehydrogenase family)